jgi:hypothetical protein
VCARTFLAIVNPADLARLPMAESRIDAHAMDVAACRVIQGVMVMRTKWIVMVVLAISVGAEVFLVSPWWSIAGLVQSVRAGDKYRTELYVDFPRVRASLREQLNAQIGQSMAKDMQDNPFVALGAMIGTVAVDRAVEAFVTPESLQRLMESELPAVDAKEAPDSRVAIARHAYDKIGLEWLSASAICVLIFEEGTGKVATTSRLEREGLRWRVVDVASPDLGLDD